MIENEHKMYCTQKVEFAMVSVLFSVEVKRLVNGGLATALLSTSFRTKTVIELYEDNDCADFSRFFHVTADALLWQVRLQRPIMKNW